MAIMTLLAANVPCSHAQNREMAARLSDLTSASIMKSSSGRFMLIGTNRVELLMMGRWLEEIVTRVNRITGVTLSQADRDFRVIVSGKGTLSASQALIDGRLSQRLRVPDSATAYSVEGHQAVCRLLLSGYTSRVPSAPLNIPPWLSVGVEQNLSPRVRRQNMMHILNAWSSGAMPTLRQLLFGSKNPDPAGSGVFVQWLTSTRNRSELFKAIFLQLEKRGAVSLDWLSARLPSGAGLDSLDARFDRWLASRSTQVHEPGTVTSLLLRRLDSELLLSPGECGIPLSAGRTGAVRLVHLVGLGDESWIPGCVQTKRNRLTWMSVGTGKSFRKVTQAYIGFLDGVTQGAKETELQALFAAAEEMRIELVGRVEECGGVLREQSDEFEEDTSRTD